jgi:hypothetical protein
MMKRYLILLLLVTLFGALLAGALLYAQEPSNNTRATYITHAVSDVNGGGFGYSSLSELYEATVAHRFSPEQIATLGIAGMALTNISFYIYSSTTYPVSLSEVKARVWTGGSHVGDRYNSGTLVAEKETTYTLNVWSSVTLDTPVIVPSDKELWIGYYVKTNGGVQYPIGIDVGPAKQGYGNLVFNPVYDTLFRAWDPPNNALIKGYVEAVMPGSATNPIPTNGATNVTISQELSWTAPTTGSIPTGYKINFGTSSPPPYVATIGNATQWTPTVALLENTRYYWRVIPTNNQGDAADCAIWYFNTGQFKPSPASLIRPTINSVSVASNVQLQWEAGQTGAIPTGFTVSVGTAPEAMTQIYSGPDKSVFYQGSKGESYYWQVVPYNESETADDCPVWTFSIQGDAPAKKSGCTGP